jgi:hypothetical protein
VALFKDKFSVIIGVLFFKTQALPVLIPTELATHQLKKKEGQNQGKIRRFAKRRSSLIIYLLIKK